MSKIFMSHSSKDKKFVKKIGTDLKKLGHDVWLDEWEIKVGDCIVQKIEEGIKDSDFLIIVLTPEAVSSGWVEREWKSVFWEEAKRNSIKVFPVLLRECEIPSLLSTKKYADFRDNYDLGLKELVQAFPTEPNIKAKDEITNGKKSPHQTEIFALLKGIQSKTVPLSQCITEVLSIAMALKNTELVEFCKKELTGWSENNLIKNPPPHRVIECFISVTEINMNYFGWDGNAANIISYMEANPDDFKKKKSFQSQPISELESYDVYNMKGVASKLIRWQQNCGSINENAEHPDALLFFYARGTSFIQILERIRSELTKKLLSLLPAEN